MMQHKFLLFSAICCCLVQAMLCAGPTPSKLPPSAMFRPRFLKQSYFSSTSTPTAPTSDDLQKMLNPMGQLPQNQSMDAPTSSSEPAPVQETPAAETAVEETPDGETSSKQSSALKKKGSKAVSKKNSNSNDPLNIADINELKERAKQVIRNLLKDENANRAITFMVISARNLLENEVASNIILTHTHLIKDTLTNEEAKEIIKDVRLEILNTVINKETPEKVKYAFEKSKQCLSREELPTLLRKRFKTLKKIIKNNGTYPAMVSVKNAIVKFVKNPDIKTKIAEGFQLLDFGVHFDPDNVLKSLGFSFFKR